MRGECLICGRPARMMAAAPTRHCHERRTCCGITYYPHYPRTIPVERGFRERAAAMPREQVEVSR